MWEEGGGREEVTAEFYGPFSCSCFATRLFIGAVPACASANGMMGGAHGGNRLCLVSQLCAPRSASTAAACPRIRASASRDGEAWTAPVVSPLPPLHISSLLARLAS